MLLKNATFDIFNNFKQYWRAPDEASDPGFLLQVLAPNEGSGLWAFYLNPSRKTGKFH